MITFSLNDISASDAYAMNVWKTINENLGYFKKFNTTRWEEAVHKTYITALDHRDDSYGRNILPYIKKLARTILKEKQKESAYGVYTDEGEISPVYHSLRDYIDTDNMDGADELKDIYKELYLLDPESFMHLKILFVYDDVTEIENLKDLRLRNNPLGAEFRRLIAKYGADFTFRVLYDFYQELPQLCAVRETGLTKEIEMKEGNYLMLDKLPDTAIIQDSKGFYHYIDKNTLTMAKDTGSSSEFSNPDYFKWDIIGSSVCDILKIDISGYMDYLYQEVFVEEGVSTKHITWCGDKYKLTTPGGVPHVGLERDKYMSIVRIELILNLLANNVGSIVALSPDSVYIKPTRSFKYDRIRLKMKTGRVMDLPITIHIKKRGR